MTVVRPAFANRLLPEYCAAPTLDERQRIVGLALVALVAIAFIRDTVFTSIVLIAISTAAYLSTLLYRCFLLWTALGNPARVEVSDEQALAEPDSGLPLYTVLVAAYREHTVISGFIRSLQTVDYPKDRLDVKVLLEEDDFATIQAVRNVDTPPYMEVLLVPPSGPRTKPKALNCGLASARGELLTVFDAEDRPEPLQLRRAAVAFSRLPPTVACLQAALTHFNAGQNMITKWFTVEYALWFGQLLPGLVGSGGVVPLGGTSTHFRRVALEQVGAWDAHNVTEDADLGVRLHRAGYRTYVFNSVTYEEANSDFVNWVKQRSRWYKGYIQTWLVHMRRPVRLWKELGPQGFISFQLFVAGTPVLALLNPIFWILTFLWFLGHFAAIAALFPSWLYYWAASCFVVGNVFFIYATMIAARAAGAASLVVAALLSPAYWVMMSVAAVKAFLQLVIAPSFWEKTAHGLTTSPPDGHAAGASLPRRS